MRACILCQRAGHEPLGRMHGRSAICQHHREALAATGRAWCHRGRHVVPAHARAQNGACHACNRARQRQERPAGMVTMRELCARLHVARGTLRHWLARGWPVPVARVGGRHYLPDLPSYPPPPDDPRRGQRRRLDLDACYVCQRPIDNPTSHPRCCEACRVARLRQGAQRRRKEAA